MEGNPDASNDCDPVLEAVDVALLALCVNVTEGLKVANILGLSVWLCVADELDVRVSVRTHDVVWLGEDDAEMGV